MMHPDYEKFTLLMPAPGKNEQSISITTSRSIVLVGSNGSGKTRLGAWLEFNNNLHKIHRISAQKILSLTDGYSSTSTERAYNLVFYGTDDANLQDNVSYYKSRVRWNGNPATHTMNDFASTIVYLHSEEVDISTKFREDAQRNKGTYIDPPESKADRLRLIFEEVLPNRTFSIKSGKVEATFKSETGDVIYKALDMSDGERAVLYLVGQSMMIPPDSIIIIDEPETHIHKSIQNKLWNLIEKERSDCLFVYLTHDIDFATSRRDAKKICVKSIKFVDNIPVWDWYEITENQDIPEETLLSIIGSRKPVLFIEGDFSSLDYFLYSNIFTTHTVMPVGNHLNVINITSAFSQSKSLHQLDCMGIIDKDFKNDNEIIKLKEDKGVYTLNLSEIENVYLMESLFKKVATRLGCNPDESFHKCKDKVLSLLVSEKQRIALEHTLYYTRDALSRFGEKSQDIKDFSDKLLNFHQQIEPESYYDKVIVQIDQIAKEADYKNALMILNHKGLIPIISKYALGIPKDAYVNICNSIISSQDVSLFHEIRMLLNMP